MRAFLKAYEDHMEMWGPHCGAPIGVYAGHLRILLDSLIEACAEEASIGGPGDNPDAIRALKAQVPSTFRKGAPRR
jgi:hypothetical protein